MRRPSPTIVVAIIALFFSLAGNVVAASGLITGHQIKDHSIGLVDLSPTAIRLLHGQQGPAGIPGPPGPTGPAGSFSQIRYVPGVPAAFSDGTRTVYANCPPGMHVIAGGASTSNAVLTASVPFGSTGWQVTALTPGVGTVYPWAVCVS